MVRQVDDFQEFQNLINGDTPVLIDFTATWCGPCQRIGPVFNTLAGDKKYEGVIFIKVDVDQNEEASEHAEISCMPTFQLWVKGEMVSSFSGANEEKLTEFADGALKHL